MPYEHRSNRYGKTFAGFFTVGALSLLAVTGTAYAALSTSTSTEADSEYVKSELQPDFRFNYLNAEDNQLVEANITPQEKSSTITFDKKITNDSALPAHSVLMVDGFDTAKIPDVLLDTTTVRIYRSDYGVRGQVDMTLREFADYALILDHAIEPDASFSYHISLSMPAALANDYSDAYGDFEEHFNTTVTFSQAISGNSPLLTYANTAGNVIRKNTFQYGAGIGFIVKKDGIASAIAE